MPTITETRSLCEFHGRDINGLIAQRKHALTALPQEGVTWKRLTADVLQYVLDFEFFVGNHEGILDSHIKEKKRHITQLNDLFNQFRDKLAQGREAAWNPVKEQCAASFRNCPIDSYYKNVLKICCLASVFFCAGRKSGSHPLRFSIALCASLVVVATAMIVLAAVITVPKIYLKKWELAGLRATYEDTFNQHAITAIWGQQVRRQAVQHQQANHKPTDRVVVLQNLPQQSKGFFTWVKDSFASLLTPTNDKSAHLLGLLNDPLVPIYKKQSGDAADIPGKFEVDPVKFAAWNKILSIEDLLATLFTGDFHALIAEAGQPESVVHFSDSDKVHEDYVQGPKAKQAFHRLMMLHLIDTAKLTTLCGGERSYLQLNRVDQLAMWPSEPRKFLHIEHGMVTIGVEFTNHDRWTPYAVESLRSIGINPVGAKWLLERLNTTEREMLRCLLLEDIIEERDLRTARSYQKWNENVGNAYKLLCGLALALESNFSLVLAPLWAQLANREGGDFFVKADQQAQEAGSSQLGPVVDSRPKYTYMKPSLQRLISSETSHEIFWRQRSGDWLLMPLESCAGRLPPDFNAAVRVIQKQYNITHHMIGEHRCFYSALAIGLLRQSYQSISTHTIRDIKLAMAQFLEDNQFAHMDQILTIVAETGDDKLSDRQRLKKHEEKIQDYLRFLKGERSRHDDFYHELDAYFFALVFGVRLEVFKRGLPIHLNDAGLVEPQLAYGPNTHRKIVLLDGDGTFYLLTPKLRNIPLENPEVKQALAVMRTNPSPVPTFVDQFTTIYQQNRW